MIITKTVVMGYVIFNSKVLLVKHKKSGRFMSCGGHVEGNELLEEALKREIKEELNLDVEIIYKKQFNNVTNELANPLVICNKIFNNKTRLQIVEYVCRVKSLDKIKINTNEILEFKLFDKNEIKSSSELTPAVKELSLKALSYANY